MTAEKIKLTPWDSAAHLKSEEDIAHYLDAMTEENDPAMIEHAHGVVAKARNRLAIDRAIDHAKHARIIVKETKGVWTSTHEVVEV